MIHYEETMIMMEEFKKAKFTEEQTKVILKAVESAQKDGLENLTTKQDLAKVESAMKQDLAKVESAMKQDLAKVESAMKQDLAKVESAMKQDLAKVESVMKQDLANVKAELKEDIHALDLKFTKLDGKVDKMQWMIGFSLALSITILVKLFMN
jgi:uncharacterized protein YcgL (UPF0745 family)